jgi:hypothetical protein
MNLPYIIYELLLTILFIIGANFLIISRITTNFTYKLERANQYKKIGIGFIVISSVLLLLGITVSLYLYCKGKFLFCITKKEIYEFTYFMTRLIVTFIIFIIGVILVFWTNNQFVLSYKVMITSIIGWTFIYDSMISSIFYFVYGCIILRDQIC